MRAHELANEVSASLRHRLPQSFAELGKMLLGCVRHGSNAMLRIAQIMEMQRFQGAAFCCARPWIDENEDGPSDDRGFDLGAGVEPDDGRGMVQRVEEVVAKLVGDRQRACA